MLMLGFVLPAAAAAPPAPAPTKAEKAGMITALLPIARIQRGAGKAMVTSDAKKGDEIIWNDNIKTERGGRARITLADQSILSLGSQAELRIVKHDARSQQTALALQYGRIRAEVAKVTRQGGSFELRTPTAVAGVIGTDFGTDASTPGVTTFICISGLVQVSNSDPNIAGSVQCAPGLTTTVSAGKAPTPPQNATPAQIQQLIQDTEPAIIAAMSPVSALPGATVDVTITGTKLAGVKNVAPNGTGLTTTLVGTPTDTSVTVHVVVAANAQPGPQMITLSKNSGAASAAMFTVMAPPVAAQSGDLKKPYVDQITQEGQTTRGSLSSYIAAVQQEADQALQQLQQNNQANVNISNASSAFTSQVSMMQDAITTAGQQIDSAVLQAGSTFEQQYNAIYQALLQRHPDGAPDQQFNDALQALFNSINGSLGNTFTAITSNLKSVVSTVNTNIAQTQQTFLQTIIAASNRPEPKVNSFERSIDLGAAFGGPGVSALDASSSKALGGASIASYNWVLCDSSYKPGQFGVPLPGTATAGCNPLSGYTSTSADFAFPTCNLVPGDYIARITVTDTNNTASAMDVKVHVLPPTYDDPPTVVRNLAQAYMGLQQNNFLTYFDETGYSGFTALQQNIQTTFPLLSSVIINTVVSQSNVTCNDATVRADWAQKFRFKSDPTIELVRTEQLSTRMVRQPGKGWRIVDFQGDNGTAPPGPIVTDSAQPNLVVTAVFPSYASGTSVDPPVPPGAQSFTAFIQNTGAADFSSATVVHFELRDSTNAVIGTGVDVPLPVPLATGGSATVQASLNVPTLAPGTKFSVVANVNPSATGETRYDDNTATEELILGTPVKLAQVASPALQVGGAAGALTVSVSAGASVTITLPTGITTADPLTQTVAAAGNVTWNLVAGFAATAGANQTLTVTANAGIPVSLTATYSVTAPAFTQTVIPSLISGGAAQALIVTVNVPGSYTLVLPSGVTTTSANPQTITGANGGTLTWNIQTSFTAATGTGLFANITSGIYSFAAKYNNAGQPNYIITSVTFASHTAPYTGANALQVGESTSVVAVIQNVGNASPTGSITTVATCVPSNPNDTTSCQGGGNPTTTVAAPAAGQSVTASMPANFNGMVPGSFTGTVTLTTAIAQSSTADDTLSLGFDVTDFVVTVQNALSPQNILPGTSQVFTVLVTTFGTTPYPVSLSASGAYTGVTYLPSITSASNGGTAAFTVTASGSTPVGAFGATITGANHGVTRPAVEPFLVMSPSIVSTNLFLNDANNPLEIQMGNTTPADVSLKLSGAAFSGTATLIPPTSVVGFTTNVNPTTSILANGTFDLTVSASTSATTVVTPMVLTAQLPNTNPSLSISYTLYVKAIGLADLAVLSATPSFNFSGAPWIDGQGVDWSVTVQNNGSSSTVGGETVTVEVNGFVAGSNNFDSANQLRILAPGASQTITVHAVAPDVHGNSAFGPQTVSGRVRVQPQPNGETNYTNNSFAISVPMANWHVAVNQATPVQVITSASGGSASVFFTGAVDGSSSANYPGLNFVPSQGQVSSSFTMSNFAVPPDIACGDVLVPANSTLCATVATSNGTLQPGPYFAQLIITLTDAVTGTTTRRQATVPLQVNTGTGGANALLASSANNCSGTSCNGTTGSTVQINGGLSEQFSVTLTMTCTNPLNGQQTSCAGVADLAIHDAVNTETTPLGPTSAIATNTPLVLRVAAATDPAGNIATGPASGYAIGINGVQHNVARPSTSQSPDPVGTVVPFSINVGDLDVTANTGANSCTGVPFNGTPLQLSVQWTSLGGFNASSLSYQWEDGNHSAVGASPLSFSNPSGTLSYSGGYSPVTFTLTNTQAKDGVSPYFLAVTISNGTSTATKYFPFYFDVSLGQNFCGAVASARGYSMVRGSWSRSAVGGISPLASIASPAASAGSDVHISASDVSFTPSMPKVGDAVQVQFRASNPGDADAKALPIALQINGIIVASDTFDVPRGHTVLGGLSWTATAEVLRRMVSSDVRRPAAKGRTAEDSTSGDSALVGTVPLQAAVVVDPQHLTKQKTALEKSAAISHLTVRGGGSASGIGTAVASGSQRILIELEDGACVGLRLSSGGTMPCGSADLEITIGDLAKSLLSLESLSGVSDVGASFATTRRSSRSEAAYNAQAAGISGHSYSVQLPNGNTAVVNVESVRNPAQLDAKAQALFRASAARVMRNMGDSSAPAGPGDLTGNGTHATVFIVLNVPGM